MRKRRKQAIIEAGLALEGGGEWKGGGNGHFSWESFNHSVSC